MKSKSVTIGGLGGIVLGVTFMVAYGIYFGVEFKDKDGKPLKKEDCPDFLTFWKGLLTHPFKAMDNSLWIEQAEQKKGE